MSREEVGERSVPGTQYAGGTRTGQWNQCQDSSTTKRETIYHKVIGGSQILNADHGITLGNCTSVVNQPCH